MEQTNSHCNLRQAILYHLRNKFTGADKLYRARRTYSDWVAGLIARRPYSVVIAAIANKLARSIWAVLATGKRYDGAAFAAAI